MKKLNKVIAVILVLGLGTAAFLSFRKEGKPGRKHNPQKQVFVYELNPSVAVKTEAFPGLVNRLSGAGFNNLRQSKTAGGLLYTSNDPAEFYEVNEAEGRFSFSRGLSRYGGNYNPSLPDPKKAQEIAMNFLNENKLMAENSKEMQLIHSGGLRADDENGTVIDKMITLTYGRVIDGVPVIGQGSKIVVNVGDKGVVEGVIRNWKAYQSKKELSQAEVKTQAEMEREFQQLVNSQFGKGAKAEIRRSYMLYFDNNGRYLQPVMAYETVLTVPGNATTKAKEIQYLGIIEAMRNPVQKLNLTALDPAALRMVNKTKVSPELKPQPTDKGD